MNVLRTSIGLLLALGTVSAGCVLDSDSDGLDAISPSAPIHTLDPGTSGGPNGLPPLAFHEAKVALLESFQTPVMTAPNSHVVNPAIETLLATKAGEATFHYAASCGLATGDLVTYDHVDYGGDGIITGGKFWMNTPLTGDAKNGVLTCIAARLNPYSIEVPVLFRGPAVEDDGFSRISDYPFVEMVISAVEDDPGRPTINVWPQEDLLDHCAEALEGSLGTRFCDNTPEECGLVLRNDFETACVGGPGAWTCDGHPAIETRLRAIDVGPMYPECDL